MAASRLAQILLRSLSSLGKSLPWGWLEGRDQKLIGDEILSLLGLAFSLEPLGSLFPTFLSKFADARNRLSTHSGL